MPDKPRFKPCPRGHKDVELLRDGPQRRFPWRVKCARCEASTEWCTTPGIAEKLWNEAPRTP